MLVLDPYRRKATIRTLRSKVEYVLLLTVALMREKKRPECFTHGRGRWTWRYGIFMFSCGCGKASDVVPEGHARTLSFSIAPLLLNPKIQENILCSSYPSTACPSAFVHVGFLILLMVVIFTLVSPGTWKTLKRWSSN